MTFTLTLPNGFILSIPLSALAENLFSKYDLTISYLDGNKWRFLIAPKLTTTSTYAAVDELLELVNVFYTVDNTVPSGEYELKINDLELTMDDGTEIREQEIIIPVTYTEPVSNELITDGVLVYYSNGVLKVSSSESETIELISLSGNLLLQTTKPAGAANIANRALHKGIYIVRGSSGWVKKLVVMM